MDDNRMYQLMEAHMQLIFIYRLLEDPVDIVILMAHLQIGYTQEEVARMLGISQAAVAARLRRIKEIIRSNDL